MQEIVRNKITLIIQESDQIGNKIHHLQKWLFTSRALLFRLLCIVLELL